MTKYLQFHYNLNDPEASSKTLVLNQSDTNYISHSFIKSPVYDNFNVKVGYVVGDDYIQQLSLNMYSVRINVTCNFLNGSSISWQFSFINDKPNYYYRPDIVNATNISSTTGEYFGKTGVISITAKPNGQRDVTIGFNYN
jgi:hypothetical protein